MKFIYQGISKINFQSRNAPGYRCMVDIVVPATDRNPT
jgi:hypothetical protein